MSVVARALEREGRGGVFYLHGDDAFRKESAARELVEAHLEPTTKDFNLDRLRASEVDLETLASVIATPPMMAEWRVVLVREVQAFAGSPRARELIVSVAQDPPPGLALILLATVPERSKAKFYRQLGKAARSFGFEPISPNDVPAWLVARTADVHGVELEEDAARALGAAVGTDLGILARELEKLTAFVAEGAAITRADVEAAGIRLPTQDRWQWFDLVAERRFEDALASLGTLLDQGESAVALVGGLGTQLLRLGVAVDGGRAALEEVLGRQKWLSRRLLPQARHWTREDLRGALTALLDLDRLLKASGVPPHVLLESWLLGELVRARNAA